MREIPFRGARISPGAETDRAAVLELLRAADGEVTDAWSGADRYGHPAGLDTRLGSAHHRAGVDAIDKAARRYARQHRRRLRPHQLLATDFSTGRSFSALERLLFSGAVHDPRVANTFAAFGTRNSSPLTLMSPRTLALAARARRAHASGA